MMADKDHRAGSPLAPANGYARSDQEAMRGDPDELRRQKRKKWLIYIVAFVIFQTGIILLFTFTVMKFRTPKFRLRSGTFDSTFDVNTTPNPSFNLTLNAQLGVKNTNFGPFKYDSTTLYISYKDTQVGSVVIPKSKANFRSTKKINVVVDLVSSNSVLANDLSSGILPLTSKATLNGKVTIMFMFKKKKSTNLSCTMDINTSTKAIQNLQCQ